MIDSSNVIILFHRDEHGANEYEPKCQTNWNATEHATEYESMESATHEECCSREQSFFNISYITYFKSSRYLSMCSFLNTIKRMQNPQMMNNQMMNKQNCMPPNNYQIRQPRMTMPMSNYQQMGQQFRGNPGMQI